MTIQKITLQDVGVALAENGYINNECGIMQYNPLLHDFEYVSDNEIISLINKLYPNFERRIIRPGLITEYLPSISNAEFHYYDDYKRIMNAHELWSDRRLKDELNQVVESHKKMKTNTVPNCIRSDDYITIAQYFINNDLFNYENGLYQYKNDKLEYYGIYQVQRLLSEVIPGALNLDDTAKIMFISGCEMDTPDISTIISEQEKRDNKKHILPEVKEAYDKIESIIKDVEA